MTAAIVIDSVGVLQRIAPTQVAKALATGQIEPTERDNVFRLIEQPLRQLTGAAKRRNFLAATS